MRRKRIYYSAAKKLAELLDHECQRTQEAISGRKWNTEPADQLLQSIGRNPSSNAERR